MSVYNKYQVGLAYGTMGMAIMTVVWKTVGMSMVPGFDQIWGLEGGEAQYPRRASDKDAQWHLFYLAMYGGLGFVAQYAGLQFSLSTQSKPNDAITATNRRRAQLLGLFHCIIGVHHTAWSLTRNWGRLSLEQFDLPMGGYLPFGVVTLLTMWHGLQLLLTTPTTENQVIIRHKVLVDTTSLSTLIECLGFLPANWVGYRNATFEYWMWLITILAPLAMYALDGYSQLTKKPHQSSSSGNKKE